MRARLCFPGGSRRLFPALPFAAGGPTAPPPPALPPPALPFGVLLVLILLFSVCGPARPFAAPADAGEPPLQNRKASGLAFRQVRPGLELALAELPESRQKASGALFVALRIDPGLHEFSLSMASEEGLSHSLAGWSRRNDLRAGINASMYLPDMITSTGFMRSGGAVNNSNLGERLGAFFVAGPRQAGLPGAAVIDKGRPDWRGMLERYDIVVQNYRFMDETGKALWKPGGSEYSMAVVAEDTQGRILFILSQEALAAENFARRLSRFGLDLRSVMYVEGGAQAGIFLRLDKDEAIEGGEPGASLPGAVSSPAGDGTVHVWKGRHSLLPFRGSPDAALPNIIGVRRK